MPAVWNAGFGCEEYTPSHRATGPVILTPMLGRPALVWALAGASRLGWSTQGEHKAGVPLGPCPTKNHRGAKS